ncbi:sarcosine oxidase subunit alpha family protein [Rhodopila sp.]|uniref:sarcosine oxidase subunit alpha family protein n=1 Tax=Rhodopila sp. TaxID=2480087 RepID=UPI003D0D7A53
MTQLFRTAEGGRIDRDRAVNFSFDGRRYQGCAGDTLASALLANGVHLVGRSFKYHRPRGILSAGPEEPNALVTLDKGQGRITPNLRATQIELYDGLSARSQNRFPSLRLDLAALTGLATPLLSAGFYYKSFMWPSSFWKSFYEPAIRRTAGLGRAPNRPDPDRYLHQHAHCDLLIIGGGAAGLAAALGASDTGARVILCDEQAEFGGSLLGESGVAIDGWTAPEWVRQAVATLTKSVTLLTRTTAFGWYPNNMIGLLQRATDHLANPASTLPRERFWRVRAQRVILATGAIERPLIFPGNDRPGIMLAEAARSYLHRYGVKVGKRIVVATAADSAYRAAVDLKEAGVAIAGIIDQRPAPDGEAIQAAREQGISIHAGMTIASTEGRGRVHSAKLANATDIIPCDTILMSGGWTPSLHLFSQSRRNLRFDEASGNYLPSEGAIGACAGTFDLARCLHDGTAAGRGESRIFAVAGMPAMTSPAPLTTAPPHRLAFVDFQNDVTTKDLAIAIDEGFVSIEHVKRYTTTGMATDQGKTSNLNALGTVAGLTGKPVETIGLTTFRPPYTPVSFGAFAGSVRAGSLAPVRLSPVSYPDAILEDAGGWKRPRCFPGDGETIDDAIVRECLAVRGNVGMLDASTLGKIEVVGPDGAAFLSRIYTGDLTTLASGRCRYALLLGEDGFIRDDGVISRLAADRFHVTTTTGGLAFVLHHMEDYRQTEFSASRVWLTSVTEQWAVISVHGPNSAQALQPFLQDIDLGTMPHMSVLQGHIGGIPIRLFRVGSTGESGFEINLPPHQAQRVWNTLRQRDISPVGTDAMHRLRAEKGYILIGQETDGTVTPGDVGLDWTISGGDFIGRRSLSLPDLKRSDRGQLVGLLPTDKTVVLEEGAQVVATHSQSPPKPSGHSDTACLGYVTSSYHSPTLGRSFALALISGGRSRLGQELRVPTRIGFSAVTVTDPALIDKSGERLRTGSPPHRSIDALEPFENQNVRIARPSSSVNLTLLAPTTRLSIKAASTAATAIGLALGVLLPTVPCRSVIARDRAALWLGPSEWLIVAPETMSDLAAIAIKAAGSHPASIVDVSYQSVMLELTGSRAAYCLNAFCALDVGMQAFPVGMCTRTLLGQVEVMVWRIAAEIFQLDVARSMLAYVWECLEQARLEYTEAPTADAEVSPTR